MHPDARTLICPGNKPISYNTALPDTSAGQASPVTHEAYNMSPRARSYVTKMAVCDRAWRDPSSLYQRAKTHITHLDLHPCMVVTGYSDINLIESVLSMLVLLVSFISSVYLCQVLNSASSCCPLSSTKKVLFWQSIIEAASFLF